MARISYLAENDPLTQRIIDQVNRSAPGPERATALLRLGERLAGVENEKAVNLSIEALSEPGVDEFHTAWSWVVRCEALFYEQKEAQSLEASYEAEKYATLANANSITGRAKIYRGMMLGGYGDLERAILLYQESIELIGTPEETDRTGWRHLATAWSQLAQIQTEAKRQEESIDAYWHAVKAADKVELYMGWPPIVTGLSGQLVKAERWEEARTVVDRGKKIWMEVSRFLPDFPGDELVDFMEQRFLAAQGLPNHLKKSLSAYYVKLDLSRLAGTAALEIILDLIKLLLQIKQAGRALKLTEKSIVQVEKQGFKRYVPQLLDFKAQALGQLKRHKQEAKALRLAIESERTLGAEQARIKAEKFKMAQEIELQFRKNAALEEANKRIDSLLLNLLPRAVVDELKEEGISHPRQFAHVGVLVGDIVGFSTKSKTMTPKELFAELNEIFSAFDGFVHEAGAQRLKTIGDAYMAVAGIMDGVENPAEKLLLVAKKALGYLKQRTGGHFNSMRWGLALGPVTAGIVGQTRYLYDIFGHAVNLAFRLESACPPGALCVDEVTALSLKGIEPKEHGIIDLKGIGPTKLYLIG